MHGRLVMVVAEMAVMMMMVMMMLILMKFLWLLKVLRLRWSTIDDVESRI